MLFPIDIGASARSASSRPRGGARRSRVSRRSSARRARARGAALAGAAVAAPLPPGTAVAAGSCESFADVRSAPAAVDANALGLAWRSAHRAPRAGLLGAHRGPDGRWLAALNRPPGGARARGPASARAAGTARASGTSPSPPSGEFVASVPGPLAAMPGFETALEERTRCSPSWARPRSTTRPPRRSCSRSHSAR
jgi:hypothetical protein